MNKTDLQAENDALMYEDMGRSGLDKNDNKKLKYKAFDVDHAQAILNSPFATDGYLIPYFDANGKLTDAVRFRFLEEIKNDKGKVVKYSQPKGTQPRLYFAPLIKWQPILKDINTPLVFVEGEKKAAKACKENIPTIGLGGVWSFTSKKQQRPLIEDFNQIVLKDRTVYLCFDNDCRSNLAVMQALRSLAKQLNERGAKVFIKWLPADPYNKIGLDDYLLDHTKDDFDALPCDDLSNMLPSDPMQTARRLLEIVYSHDLIFCNGTFHNWTGTHYREISDEAIKSSIWQFLEGTTDENGEKTKPSRNMVADISDALKAVTYREILVSPYWLDDAYHYNAEDMLACQNGLLHLPSKRLIEHTSAFFNLNALNFAYNPKAKPPKYWMDFLVDLFGTDKQSIDTLQEMFGYLLSCDTSQQKIFLIVGPKRAGKGTIARVLKELIGLLNICGPTISGLCLPFGLAQLIGKLLAIISDARLSGRLDQQIVTERLLAISGEDTLTIDRKYREPWTGKLPTRILILTNEIPRLSDSSGALASRFIVLKLTNSFYGKEDPKLTDKLLTEMPAILNWAIAGWLRLQKRGYFIQPKSALQAVAELEDLGSPISAFIRECCQVGPAHEVLPKTLYLEWVRWCKAQGRDHPGTLQTFSRDLHAAISNLNTVQRGSKNNRVRMLQGIALRPDRLPPLKKYESRDTR